MAASTSRLAVLVQGPLSAFLGRLFLRIVGPQFPVRPFAKDG